MVENSLLNYIFENHKGKDNPVTSAQLEGIFGIKGCEVRTVIRGLRRRGIPIGTSIKGYFYCVTEDEYNHLINDLRSRAFSMLDTVRLLEKAKHENGKQLTFSQISS